MIDGYSLSVITGKPAPLLLEDRQAQMTRRTEQIDCDEEHDMQIANAKVKRAFAPWLVVVAIVIALWANELVNGDAGQEYFYRTLLSGVIAGCAAVVSPSLVLRDKVKKYYKLKREKFNADFGIGDDD